MHPPRILALAIVITSTGLSAQTGAPWTTPTLAEVDAIYPDIEALYMDLHRNPELAFQETRTAAALAARVKALGFEVTTAVGRTGIVAVMRNGAGPTVMLRTELDALPVEEKTGLPFASSVVAKNAAGQMVPVMHACGHDLHMAAWAGAARLMAEHRDRWRGTLLMVGQPAEEGAQGASAMLNDGLFTRFPRPDFALSLHDDDTMPAGTIGYHPGYFRAMSDSVTITVYGRGGHAAMPHNTIDPVVLAARIVLSLQTIVARENNPVDPVVITIGSIHGGTQANIIPDEVRLQLSVRTYTPQVRSSDARGHPSHRARRGPFGGCSAGAAGGRTRERRRSRVQRSAPNVASRGGAEERSRRKGCRRDATEDDLRGFRAVRPRGRSVDTPAHRSG